MGNFYVTYNGGWRQGNPIVVNIPIFTETYNTYPDYVTMTDAILATDSFDNTYTLLTRYSDRRQSALNMGFTDVILIDSTGLDLYFSETKHILITLSSTNAISRKYMDGESVLLSSTASSHLQSLIGLNSNNQQASMNITMGGVGFRFNCALTNAGEDFMSFWSDIEPFVPVTDPYENGGGASGTGGGTGTFSDTGDLIGVPSLPTLSAVDTGFITLFNPTLTQLKALANYMWSNSFDMSLWKNIVANPMDCILGLSIVPVDPPNAGTRNLVVGNMSTDVAMDYISTQYVEVDCGTLNIVEFWGSYLDYSPYTKIQLYLPYLGIVPVDIDDMQNSTIHVVYHVDVLSGACVAYVLCGGTQLYTYVGQCSSNIPITSNDFTNVVTGALSIGASIASIVVSEGATAPQAVGTIANASVNMLKPNIKKSGAMSGTGGMMGVQTPYLICQRPRQSVPHDQNHFTGYPSNITYTLSDLSGYTEVQNIHLDNVPCTDAEMNEILEYLTGGVVI